MIVTICMKSTLKMSNQIRFNLLVLLTIVSILFALLQVIHSAEVLSDPRYKPVALAETVKVINGNNNGVDGSNDPLKGVQFVNADAPVLDKVVQADEIEPPLMKSVPYLGKFRESNRLLSTIDETFLDTDNDDLHPDDPMEEAYMEEEYRKINNEKNNLDGASDQIKVPKLTSASNKVIDPRLADNNMQVNFPFGASLTNPIYPDRVTRNGTKTISHYKIMVPVWIPHKMPDGADSPINRRIMTTEQAVTANDSQDIKLNEGIQSNDQIPNLLYTNDVGYFPSRPSGPAVVANDLDRKNKSLRTAIITDDTNSLTRVVNPATVTNTDGQTESLNPALVTNNFDGAKLVKTVRELHKTYEPRPVPQTVLTKFVMKKDKNAPNNMSPNVDPKREIVLGESESVYDQ